MPLDTSIPLQVQAPQFAQPVSAADREYNALRAQALQQEMMRNQLIMQNTMEDRARAEQSRRAAAAQAAAERRRQQEFMATIRSGYDPGKTAVMGPGTVQASVPASYDPNRVLNALYAKGDPTMLKSFSDMQEQIAKQQKAEAEVPGVRAESTEKQTKAEVAKLDAAVSRYIPAVRGVSTPDDAMRLTDMLYDDPTLGPLLSGVAPREQARAQAAQEFAADPVGFMRRHLLTGKELYDATTAAKAPMKYSVQDTAQGIMRVPEAGTGPAIPLTGPSGEPLMPVDRRSVTNIDMKGEGAFAGELGKLEAADVMKNRAAAEDARSVVDTINTGRSLLDKGIISGFGADFKLGFAKALKEAGVTGLDGKIANTETYASNMAQNVGKLIKQFGAGTGLSNADREYAEKMAGGSIALSEESMRRILDISERAARNSIAAHNKRVEGVQSKTGLTVEMPPTTATVSGAGGTSVTTPDGRVFSFPTPEAAAQFKKAAGIP